MTQLEGNVIVKEQEPSIDYERIASSQDFKQLLSEKKKFIASLYHFFYGLLASSTISSLLHKSIK